MEGVQLPRDVLLLIVGYAHGAFVDVLREEGFFPTAIAVDSQGRIRGARMWFPCGCKDKKVCGTCEGYMRVRDRAVWLCRYRAGDPIVTEVHKVE